MRQGFLLAAAGPEIRRSRRAGSSGFARNFVCPAPESSEAGRRVGEGYTRQEYNDPNGREEDFREL